MKVGDAEGWFWLLGKRHIYHVAVASKLTDRARGLRDFEWAVEQYEGREDDDEDKEPVEVTAGKRRTFDLAVQAARHSAVLMERQAAKERLAELGVRRRKR